jgi:putative hemolysin
MIRLLTSIEGRYAHRFASSSQDLEEVQRTRYQVFNVELHEGLDESGALGLDQDAFDPVCDHLIVEDRETGRVVGTYRLQTGANAAARLGYYSEQEFDFRPYESIRGQIVELGRACVLASHRNLFVLGLLWKGIGSYALEHGSRYLMGCSSLTSQDPAMGATAYQQLASQWLVEPHWRTLPTPDWQCPLDTLAGEAVMIPKLLRAYLGLGGKICGPPALDTRFKTIDFLTMVDLDGISAADRSRFMA